MQSNAAGPSCSKRMWARTAEVHGNLQTYLPRAVVGGQVVQGFVATLGAQPPGLPLRRPDLLNAPWTRAGDGGTKLCSQA